MRDTQDGPLDLDQPSSPKFPLPSAGQHAAGDGEVAVEPRMLEYHRRRVSTPTWMKPLADRLLTGLMRRVGGVGVCSDHADGVARLPFGTDGEEPRWSSRF